MSSLVPALFWIVASAANPAMAAAHDSEAQAQPDVVFEETEYDFGSMFSEERYTHRFRFRSPAGLAVTVTKVAAPCKCTAAVVRLPGAGAGQEWGEIEVKVNFGDADGEVSKRVDVYVVTGKPAAARARFLMGYSHLVVQEYGKAKEAFDLLCIKYPQSRWAKTAEKQYLPGLRKFVAGQVRK